jgi:hypothetical protein
MSAIVALVDANVFYSAALRDLMMQLALAGLYRPRWTRRIEEEWTRGLLANRPDISKAQLAVTRALMRRAVPNSLVQNYGTFATRVQLPDPDDRHVVAAAIRAQAKIIITHNLRDFPPEILRPYDIVAQHPDVFLAALGSGAPLEVLAAVRECRARLTRPTFSPAEYLAVLARQGLQETTAFLRIHIEAI